MNQRPKASLPLLPNESKVIPLFVSCSSMTRERRWSLSGWIFALGNARRNCAVRLRDEWLGAEPCSIVWSHIRTEPLQKWWQQYAMYLSLPAVGELWLLMIKAARPWCHHWSHCNWTTVEAGSNKCWLQSTLSLLYEIPALAPFLHPQKSYQWSSKHTGRVSPCCGRQGCSLEWSRVGYRRSDYPPLGPLLQRTPATTRGWGLGGYSWVLKGTYSNE